MNEHDVSIEVLHEVRDLGLRAQTRELSARVGAAVEREIQAELDGQRPRRASRFRPTIGSLAVVVSTLVAVAIAIGAIALLQHRTTPGHPTAASADRLRVRLAVLRRPQTAADVLPARLRLKHPGFTIIPSLTRLVASPPGARLFLVVSAPTTVQGALWEPSLGDQVSIQTVTSTGAVETRPAPAADLYDATNITPGGDFEITSRGVVYRTDYRSLYVTGVVPDGVARVRWTFAGASGKPGRVIDATVRNNVAYTRLLPSTETLLRATWYAADGRVIPTTDRPFKRAIALRQQRIRARLLRTYAGYSYRAPASMLADFSVFSIARGHRITTSAGLTISTPAWAALPFQILELIDPRAPQRLDLNDMREIRAPSGATAWIIPGQRGLCLVVADPVRSGGRDFGNGGGETCASTTQAETMGIAVGSRNGEEPMITYRVLPHARPAITVRTAPHARRTVRPPYGVYVTTIDPSGH